MDKTQAGRSFTCQLREGRNVESLKDIVHDFYGPPTHRQLLSFRDRVLNDEESIPSERDSAYTVIDLRIVANRGCCDPCWGGGYRFPAEETIKESYCWCGCPDGLATCAAGILSPFLYCFCCWSQCWECFFLFTLPYAPPLTCADTWRGFVDSMAGFLCCTIPLMCCQPKFECRFDGCESSKASTCFSHRCIWCGEVCWAIGFFPNDFAQRREWLRKMNRIGKGFVFGGRE